MNTQELKKSMFSMFKDYLRSSKIYKVGGKKLKEPLELKTSKEQGIYTIQVVGTHIFAWGRDKKEVLKDLQKDLDQYYHRLFVTESYNPLCTLHTKLKKLLEERL